MVDTTPSKLPFTLISKTGREKYPEFESHTCATQCSIMGEFHNILFRAFNSAYLSSYIIKPGTHDVADFLEYNALLCVILKSHHDWEEYSMFPALEKFAEEPGLMQTNTEQHKAFEEGFHKFHTYCEDSETMKNFDSSKYREMLDSFAPALNEHMHAEPETFYRLRYTDSEGLRKVRTEQEKIATAKGEPFKIIPVILGNGDRNFSVDGSTEQWHKMPWILPYLTHYIFSWRYRRLWRFNSSDYFSNPK